MKLRKFVVKPFNSNFYMEIFAEHIGEVLAKIDEGDTIYITDQYIAIDESNKIVKPGL